MRIRSIRPEFWTSEDIAALCWGTRLIYIGLWSYVDDNGVGRDNAKLIAADLFPLDEDTHGVLTQVDGALNALAEGGQITRYTVDGKPYLHVVAWTKHQVINRPSKGRYPLPTCENAVHRTAPHVALTEYSTPGEGEKGRRGEGEKVPPTAARDSVAARTDPAGLVAEWIDRCGARPPTRVIGQVGKELKAMLTEGIPVEDVRAGLAAWHAKGLHPSALASVVHETRTAGQRNGVKPSTTDQRVNAALALLPRMAALDAADEAAQHRPAIGH